MLAFTASKVKSINFKPMTKEMMRCYNFSITHYTRSAHKNNHIMLNTLQGNLDRVTFWMKVDNYFDLEALITGTPGSPYEKGFFKLDIHLPERHPFEPPIGCVL
jgi:hypothetical protein